MTPKSDAPFRVERTTAGAMEILALSGELDLASRALLTAELDAVLAAEPVVLALDLRGLRFIDASGIQVLVRTERRCQERGRRFFLVRGGPGVEQALVASGLGSYFEIVDTPDRIDDGDVAPAPA